MFVIIRKKIFTLDVVILFVILSAVHFKGFFLSCVNYLNLSFNSQIPLTWDFTSLNNVLPYKDIYFPYGILFYFKNTNVFLSIIYFLLPTIFFISVYLVLKNVFKNNLIAFVSFISFYLFIFKYTGVENFTRYGIILCIALLFSYIFYKLRLISMKISFFIGLLIGGIFSLVNDQGIYAFLFFIFFLAVIPLLKKVENLNYFSFLLSRIAANMLGVIVGILPFFIFLYSKKMISEFLLFMSNLSDFVLYAKTPFIPFSTTIDNLFTFTSLFVAIVALSYKLFFSQRKLSLLSFVEISLVFILVLLEQKSIIRSIDKQITFIAFFLYIVMFYELVRNRINNYAAVFCFVIISLLVLSEFGLHSFVNYKLDFKIELIGSFFHENINDFLINKGRFCLDDNLNKLIVGKSTKFEKVKKIIEKDSKGYSKIFDYLSDPLFYVLFNQKPPYYFTIFEATPLYAQESNTRYIEENKVKYIIYNTGALRIQDGVPDYIRTKVLFKYVLNNFKELDKVENFIIYKKIEEEN